MLPLALGLQPLASLSDFTTGFIASGAFAWPLLFSYFLHALGDAVDYARRKGVSEYEIPLPNLLGVFNIAAINGVPIYFNSEPRKIKFSFPTFLMAERTNHSDGGNAESEMCPTLLRIHRSIVDSNLIIFRDVPSVMLRILETTIRLTICWN